MSNSLSIFMLFCACANTVAIVIFARRGQWGWVLLGVVGALASLVSLWARGAA